VLPGIYLVQRGTVEPGWSERGRGCKKGEVEERVKGGETGGKRKADQEFIPRRVQRNLAPVNMS
jgi:hypothetical protein